MKKKRTITPKQERCVLCHKILDIPVDTHISLRQYYIEGGGQLCGKCFEEVYGKTR